MPSLHDYIEQLKVSECVDITLYRANGQLPDIENDDDSNCFIRLFRLVPQHKRFKCDNDEAFQAGLSQMDDEASEGFYGVSDILRFMVENASRIYDYDWDGDAVQALANNLLGEIKQAISVRVIVKMPDGNEPSVENEKDWTNYTVSFSRGNLGEPFIWNNKPLVRTGMVGTSGGVDTDGNPWGDAAYDDEKLASVIAENKKAGIICGHQCFD